MMILSRQLRQLREMFWVLVLGLLVVGAASYFASRPVDPATYKEGESPEMRTAEHRLAIVTAAGAALAFLFGLHQYQRAEQWKRTEFLAGEMEKFFADKTIRNALTMIDYAPRRINLYHTEDLPRDEYPRITRPIQSAALLLHTELRASDATQLSSDRVAEGAVSLPSGAPLTAKSRFTPDEAEIRDTYDRLLDNLERISAHLVSDLIEKRDLDPYLEYWIKDIAAFTTDPDDAAWTCALFDYIAFYEFRGVQKLFEAYGENISPSKERYRALKAVPGVAERLEARKWVSED